MCIKKEEDEKRKKHHNITLWLQIPGSFFFLKELWMIPSMVSYLYIYIYIKSLNLVSLFLLLLKNSNNFNTLVNPEIFHCSMGKILEYWWRFHCLIWERLGHFSGEHWLQGHHTLIRSKHFDHLSSNIFFSAQSLSWRSSEMGWIIWQIALS